MKKKKKAKQNSDAYDGRHYKELLELFVASPDFEVIKKEVRDKFHFDFDAGTGSFAREDFGLVLPYFDEVAERFGFPRPFGLILTSYFKRKDMAEVLRDFLPYGIRVYPFAQINQNNPEKSVYAKEVSIVTYSRLNTEEKKMAIKELEEAQNMVFPPHLKQRRRISPTLELSLKAEERGKTRERKRFQEVIIPHSYLDILSKSKISPEKFEETKRKNLSDIEIKEVGKNSADIAESLLGPRGKPERIRTMISRVNKKRKKLIKPK